MLFNSAVGRFSVSALSFMFENTLRFTKNSFKCIELQSSAMCKTCMGLIKHWPPVITNCKDISELPDIPRETSRVGGSPVEWNWSTRMNVTQFIPMGIELRIHVSKANTLITKLVRIS